MSVLGIYKKEAFNKTLRIGTPDPSKYHDSRTVRLEGANEVPVGAKLPPNSKFSLPGIVIPHAKREGGSMGWNSEAPMRVFIDPEQTGGQLQVDIGDIRRNPKAMTDAIKEAFSQHAEHEDAIIEAFAKFNTAPSKVQNMRPVETIPAEPVREAPLQMRGTYVAPKATPGGGQLKAASFSKKPDIQEPKQPMPNLVDTPQSAAAISASKQARSLHEELAGPAAVMCNVNRPMRKVTFELPLAQGGSLGQFDCLYSDIIIDPMNLVLVYDHSNPSQSVWWPPALENPETGEPLGIAVLIHGLRGEESTLFMAFPTGVRFKYYNQEFCLLMIEKSKTMGEK